MEAGLSMTFIEAPEELQTLGLVIPQSHKDSCAKLNISMEGNAAGHGKKGSTDGWLDLTGAPSEPPINSWGALVDPPDADALTRKMRRVLKGSRLGRFVGY